jgi:hypothetical protein
MKKMNNEIDSEINISKILTETIVDTNISHHIVKFIDNYECNNAKNFFKNCPTSYVKFINTSEKRKTTMCTNYFMGHPDVKLSKKTKVMQTEFCDYKCSTFITEVSEMTILEMQQHLDIFFFQIIYTIMSVQDLYPYFIHGDLFMRNIIGHREKCTEKYHEYSLGDKMFYVPQKKFFPKIIDFGMSNLNEKYKNRKLFKSRYKDVYNIVLDVYDGGNLGGTSLMELCKTSPEKIEFLKTYFSNYFNIDIVDYFIMKSRNEMIWNWNNILDNEFLNEIEMVDPRKLIGEYFYDKFKNK